MLRRESQDDEIRDDDHADTQKASAATQLGQEVSLPKNQSTSNLLLQASAGPNDTSQQKRFSIDVGTLGDHVSVARSSVALDHEHGIGASGLGRIRQQPSRAPTLGPNYSQPSRSPSFTFSIPPSRQPSMSLLSGPTSPSLTFGEDLNRFPSESLHSFSFAQHTEDSIHSRQSLLKRSIEFMRDRFGWAASSPGIAKAQAKISGDQDMKRMMELLTTARMFEQEGAYGPAMGYGPLTGPAGPSGENVFEKSFMPTLESPTEIERPEPIGLESEESGAISESEHTGAREDSVTGLGIISEDHSRRTTQESNIPRPLAPLASRRAVLKRTYTDVAPLSLQDRLTEALARPYNAQDRQSTSFLQSPTGIPSGPGFGGHASPAAPHGHGNRWAPAAQAVFTTEAISPWTITSANDLACLVFGVTRSEVRKMGIMEVIREDRREWLEKKLRNPGLGALLTSPSSAHAQSQSRDQSPRISPSPSAFLAIGNGVTARLLSKPPSRQMPRKSKTVDSSGPIQTPRSPIKPQANRQAKNSRGVLICGDVVPIQKRNGAAGSASLWVKEKRGSLIWVLEEIAESVAYLSVDEIGSITKATGAVEAVWGVERVRRGMDIKRLIPNLPKLTRTNTGALDYDEIAQVRRYTARTSNDINIPVSVDKLSGEATFRVSSLPHIAGIMVLSAVTLEVKSANTAFCSALFGHAHPEGIHITEMIPNFDDILDLTTAEESINLTDGLVIPEHSFRKGRALLAVREGKADAAAVFLRPSGLPAKHRDGAEIMIDVQMRVVRSEPGPPKSDEKATDEKDEGDADTIRERRSQQPEVVFALWITYSRHLHAANHGVGPVTPFISRPATPLRQPSPGQSIENLVPDLPEEADSDEAHTEGVSPADMEEQVRETTSTALLRPLDTRSSPRPRRSSGNEVTPPHKSINDFVILEDMGQGAYGQVKLTRYKNTSKKVVIKYVTKRRILVDTWTRDRRLGTVPLEIHVLDYLRRDGLKHPNIVEMADFFEDDVNYYIEMVPHGLPGMDLFDYIELRVNMDEEECKKIFVQVTSALHHLHIKAKVVHRDIKDENVILDGEGNIKLIDFGSATYIKNGPFDVFVGTIDYAAPEVLAGKPYRGKEQDVWALGILLYTIIFKENPFYSIDEIMDHDLRVPYIMSEDSMDLVRAMLDRDVDRRVSIGQVLEHPWCKGVGNG